MRILQVSKEARIGGAGIAAYRLHKGLRALGAESVMLVNKVREPEVNIVAPSTTLEKVAARLTPILDRIPGRFSSQGLERVSSSWVPDNLSRRIKELHPDILNLHWVNDGFMRIETLARFRQPVVWTLHDMWAFTGGEHYVSESTRYKEGYSHRNRPDNETGLDVNRWLWRRKRKAWSRLRNMVIVTPSRWLARCARESVLFGDLRVEVLPNGIDHERFRPMDHTIVRRILGLPEDKKLILFGAGSATRDKRKGFHLLVDSLKRLEKESDPAGYELVVFGSSSGDGVFAMNTHYLGKLHDEISMALVYAAADVFVAPSLEDNLPNTVLESLSCGTPVVAFNIGGMPDMVSHKTNGYLAAGFDTADLANGLLWVLNDADRWQALSNQARNTVVDCFTLQNSASRYLGLYEEILHTT
jgi:glycosyltransferase involved in cell wall biosynthesis